MIVGITVTQRLENGLVVGGKLIAFTMPRAPQKGQKLKEQITYIEDLCKHMEIEITGTEKKVFSLTDL